MAILSEALDSDPLKLASPVTVHAQPTLHEQPQMRTRPPPVGMDSSTKLDGGLKSELQHALYSPSGVPMKSEPCYSPLDCLDRQTMATSFKQWLSMQVMSRVPNRSALTINCQIARNSKGTTYRWRYAQRRRVRKGWYVRPMTRLVVGNPQFESTTELLRQR